MPFGTPLGTTVTSYVANLFPNDPIAPQVVGDFAQALPPNPIHGELVSHFVDKLDTTRLTFTPPLINGAASVAFLVGGAGKAGMLAQVLDGPVNVDVTPSQVVQPANGQLTWIVDEAAAANLERNQTHG